MRGAHQRVSFPAKSHLQFFGCSGKLNRRNGTLDRLYEHWILGRAPEDSPPRWSVIRDVLHWVD